MNAYIFTMYKEGKAVKNIRIFAYSYFGASGKADDLIKNNPHKYDDWELN